MTDSKISTEYFIGEDRPGKWSGIAGHRPQNTSLLASRGQLFVLASLIGPKDFDCARAGNSIVEHLQEVYFGDQEKKVIPAVQDALDEARKRLITLLQHEKQASEQGIDLDIQLLVLRDKFVYFAQLGEGKICAYRKGKVIDLGTALQQSKQFPQKAVVGSAILEKEDVFVLCTKRLVDMVNEEMLKEVGEQFALDLVKKGLKGKDLSAKAILLIGFDIEEKERAKIVPVAPLGDQEEVVVEGETDGEKETKPVDKDNKGEWEVLREGKDLGEVDAQKAPVDKLESDEDGEKQPGEESVGKSSVPSVIGGKLPDKRPERLRSFFDKAKDRLEEAKIAVSAKINKVRGERLSKEEDKEKRIGLPDKEDRRRGDGNEQGFLQPKRTDKTYVYIAKKVLRLIVEFFAKVKEFVSITLGLQKRGLYLKGGGYGRSWKLIALLVVIIAILLYFSIRAISRHRDYVEKDEKVQELLDKFEDKFAEAEKVADLNRERARTYISDAESFLASARSYEIRQEEIEEATQRVQSLRDRVDKVIVVTAPEIITDLGAYFEGAGSADMATWEGKLYVSDPEKGAIYTVSTSSGSTPEKLLDRASGLGRPKWIAFDESGTLFVFDEEKGLMAASASSRQLVALTGLSPTSLGNIASIECFASGGEEWIYMLRPDSNEIRRSQKIGSSYGQPGLRTLDPGLSGSKDLEIDGNIYALGGEEGVIRIYEGIVTPYPINDLDKSIKGSVALETNKGQYNLYVLDAENERVVVVSKPLEENFGRFLAQIVYRGEKDLFKDFKEIVVDASEQNMYVLSGTKVVKISLEGVQRG